MFKLKYYRKGSSLQTFDVTAPVSRGAVNTASTVGCTKSIVIAEGERREQTESIKITPVGSAKRGLRAHGAGQTPRWPLALESKAKKDGSVCKVV